MARLFCERCQKDSNFLPIYAVMKVAGVSRSTIYYWLEHGWVHWRELPSGRRVICQASLSRSAKSSSECPPRSKPAPKTVQNCPIAFNPVA